MIHFGPKFPRKKAGKKANTKPKTQPVKELKEILGRIKKTTKITENAFAKQTPTNIKRAIHEHSALINDLRKFKKTHTIGINTLNNINNTIDKSERQINILTGLL